MEQTVKTNVWMLLLSRLFERAGYYGVRSILILYATSAIINFPENEVWEMYSYLSIGVVVFGLIGALLGDLIKINSLMLFIGGVFQILGVLVICIPNPIAFIAGVACLLVGTGLYGANALAQIGKSYLHKKHLMDVGFGLNYIMINIGAFAGVFFVLWLSDWSFYLGFLLAGICFVVSTIFNGLYTFLPKEDFKEVAEYDRSIGLSIVLIFTAIITVSLFWFGYEVYSRDSYYMIEYVFNSNSIYQPENYYQFTANLNLLVITIFGGLMLLFWWLVKMSSTIKFFVGFIFAAVAFLIFYGLERFSGDAAFGMFLLATIIFGISEFIISVASMAIVAKNVNPRFYALIFAGMAAITLFVNHMYELILGIYRYITGQSTISLFVFFGLMIFIGLLILLIYIIVKLTGSKESKLQL